MPKIIGREQCDVVHFPHFNVSVRYKGNYIVTIHDLTPKFFPGPIVRRSVIRRLGYEVVFKAGIVRARSIITISQHTKKQLVQYQKSVQQKIHVINLGVDPRFHPIELTHELERVKGRYGITKPYIVYVGVWRDHKNIPGLVRAFEILRNNYGTDCQLVLCGTPDNRYPEINASIQQSPFRNDIITPGFVEDGDLPALYGGATVNALVSFAEGFGLVALEAAACGTPTICSDSTSVPEILGDATLSCDPHQPLGIADKINMVFSNQSLRETLIDHGFQAVKKYSWNACAKETLDIYRAG